MIYTFKFFISFANFNKFAVPRVFTFTAISSGSLNFTVAAQWKIKFTFLIIQSRSVDDNDMGKLSKSPSTILTKLLKFGFSLRSRSNSFKTIFFFFNNNSHESKCLHNLSRYFISKIKSIRYHTCSTIFV